MGSAKYHHSQPRSNGTAACSQWKYFGAKRGSSLTDNTWQQSFRPRHSTPGKYASNLTTIHQSVDKLVSYHSKNKPYLSMTAQGKYFMPSENSLCICCLLNLTTRAHRSQPQQTTTCAPPIRDGRLDLWCCAVLTGKKELHPPRHAMDFFLLGVGDSALLCLYFLHKPGRNLNPILKYPCSISGVTVIDGQHNQKPLSPCGS